MRLLSLCLVLVAISLFMSQPSHSCPDHERYALLQFKHSFIINCAVASDPATAYPKVHSWAHHEDCCSWDGVQCDKKTGHVIGLDLSSSCLYGTFSNNSSLFSLTHLRHLTLRDNHFNLSEIPPKFGQLSKLVRLDLSESSFNGQIPLEISNLSMLSLLDLSNHGIHKADSQLILNDPGLEKLVQNLSRLSLLDLSSVDISSSVPNILANLTHLKGVEFMFCNLIGQFPIDFFHLPHLEMLDVTGNINLAGILPEFQHNSHLRELYLQDTSFHGRLPSSIGELANLEYLALESCDFSGPIPSSLGNLTKLIALDLSGTNAFSGDLPSSLTNLTQLQTLGLSYLDVRLQTLTSWLSNLNQLTWLSLQFMNLGGSIPSVIANLTSLQVLGLKENQLTGEIPQWLMNLTQLNLLALPNNQFKGPIPLPIISQLVNLRTLDMGGNWDLYGKFESFLKLKNLRDVTLSGVKLTSLSENTTYVSLAKLNYLDLTSCNLTEIPHFLRDQDQLQELNLGDNFMGGFIPQWFVNATQESLHSLDLSNNFFIGFEQPVVALPWSHLQILYMKGNHLRVSLPIPPSSMVVYDFSNNQLAGGIPYQICQANSMNYFDISNNNLSGRIPNCISELSTSLSVLNLEGNNFHGNIPLTYPKSCSLKMINLSNNQLEGRLPRSLTNCMNLGVLDVGRNQINDTFPSWLGILPKLHILALRFNHFHGKINKPNMGFSFRSLRIIDLSHNFHTGDLPSDYIEYWDAMKLVNESRSSTYGTDIEYHISSSSGTDLDFLGYPYSITITNKGNDRQYTKVLTVLRVLDFSSNNFIGKIPNVIGELKGLQALNLSNNNLQGGIPSLLANMTDLESLDLSNNMLSGEIPQELTQLTFLEVFNVSRNILTGPIPEGKQFGTFDDSSFVGNLGLCGSPLSKKCGNAFEPSQPFEGTESNDDSEEDSMLIDWIIICLGCIGGFAIGCAFGKYLTDQNHEWFVETFVKKKKKKEPSTRATRAARR